MIAEPRPPGLYGQPLGVPESLVPRTSRRSDTPAIKSGTDTEAGSSSGGPVTNGLHVWITAAPGGVIYFTLDGTDPTVRSAKYDKRFLLTSEAKVRAISVEPGKGMSAVAAADYYELSRLSGVVFSPAGGDSPATVTMSVPGHSDATIRYTVDGSVPTSNSTVYSAPISTNQNGARVTAVAFKSGWTESFPSSAFYQPELLPLPTISGTRQSNPLLVSLGLSGDDLAYIFFTVDGSDPSPTNYAGARQPGQAVKWSDETTPVLLTTPTLVRAAQYQWATCSSGDLPVRLSRIAEKSFGYPVLPAPTFSPSSQSAIVPLDVAVSVADHSDAEIRFTVNGHPAGPTSEIYLTPIHLASPSKLSVWASKPNWGPSSGSAQYSYTANPALGLVATPAPGNIPAGTVALSVPGFNSAVIYYTTNGSTPTTSSSVYSSPITVSSNLTIKALAVLSGYADGTLTAAYTVGTAPSITVQPQSQSVSSGDQVTFSVTATGTATLSYQWRKGGVSISGATSSTYVIASAVSGDAGNYSVVVTNAFGVDTSATASLTVGSAVAAVTFSPTSGADVPSSGNLTVTLSTSTSGATIYYTLDGSDVTAGGPSVLSGASGLTVTIFSGQSGQISARAGLSGSFSSVTSASYAAAGQLAPVVFTPATGSTVPVSVVLTAESQTVIYYSTNPGAVAPPQGQTPSSPWVQYSSPVNIGTVALLLAQARSHPTKSNSLVSTAAYGIAANTVKVGYVRNDVDRVGSWGTFAANGDAHDVQFNFYANFPVAKTIHCIAFIDNNNPNNGWATWRYYYDVSMGNGTVPNFSYQNGSSGGIFPLVIDKAGVQLNSAYATPISTLTISGAVHPTNPSTWVPASTTYNNDSLSPRGNLGNYSGLVNFSLFGSNNGGAWQASGKTMKIIVYATDVGGTAVTRYTDIVTIP